MDWDTDVGSQAPWWVAWRQEERQMAETVVRSAVPERKREVPAMVPGLVASRQAATERA